MTRVEGGSKNKARWRKREKCVKYTIEAMATVEQLKCSVVMGIGGRGIKVKRRKDASESREEGLKGEKKWNKSQEKKKKNVLKRVHYDSGW